MSKLVRMDQTGHTTLAEWRADDPAAVERCRDTFPSLRILSGVELGEAHRFPEEAAAVLRSGPLDLVLGSVHTIPMEGELVEISSEVLAPSARESVRVYFFAWTMSAATQP